MMGRKYAGSRRFVLWLSPFIATAIAVLVCGCSSAPKAATKNSAPLYSQLPASIRSSGELTVVEFDNPPAYETGSGAPKGFNVDFGNALQKELGVKVVHEVVGGLAPMITGIEAGRYDATLGPIITGTPNTLKLNIVTYLKSQPGFLLPHGSSISSVYPGLCGKTIALQQSSAPSIQSTEYMSKRCTSTGKAAIKMLQLPSNDAAELAVLAGRADAISLGGFQAVLDQRAAPSRWSVLLATIADYPVVVYLGLGVPIADTQLAKVMHEAVVRMQQDGTFAQIANRWGMKSYVVPSLLNPCKASPPTQCTNLA
jgi:polar amino acid transport system substrate-binding protein